MGFGHRMYKNYDPRAASSEDRRHHPRSLGVRDDLLDIAGGPRRGRPARRFTSSRAGCTRNVDFYTGVICRAMGLTRMFTRTVRARPVAQLDPCTGVRCEGPDHQDRPPATVVHRLHRTRLRRPQRPISHRHHAAPARGCSFARRISCARQRDSKGVSPGKPVVGFPRPAPAELQVVDLVVGEATGPARWRRRRPLRRCRVRDRRGVRLVDGIVSANFRCLGSSRAGREGIPGMKVGGRRRLTDTAGAGLRSGGRRASAVG